jgi:aquaporin Z
MKYKACFSERIGTCLLVFTGTAAIVINDSNGGASPHPGVALLSWLVIAALIYAFGDISGASMNPARSLGSARLSDQFTILWLT